MFKNHKVGDTIVYYRGYPREHAYQKKTVTKIGRKYIYINSSYDEGFDIETGRSNKGTGQTYIMTVEAYELSNQREKARKALKDSILDPYNGVKKEHVLTVRALLSPLIDAELEGWVEEPIGTTRSRSNFDKGNGRWVRIGFEPFELEYGDVEPMDVLEVLSFAQARRMKEKK